MRYQVGDLTGGSAGGSLLPTQATPPPKPTVVLGRVPKIMARASGVRLPSAVAHLQLVAPSRTGSFTIVGRGGGEAAPLASSAPSGPDAAADAGSFAADAGTFADPAGVAPVAPSPILPALTQKVAGGVPTLPQDQNGPSSLEWAGIGIGVVALVVGAYFVLR